MATTHSNTETTDGNILIKEDVADMLIKVDPTSTPICSYIGYSKVASRNPEWPQIDLVAPNADNALEPAFKTTYVADTDPVKVGNNCQIVGKSLSIDDAMDSEDIYGNQGKTAEVVARKTMEIRRDFEKAVLGNKASVKPVKGTAGKLAGFSTQIKTNASLGQNGSIAGWSNGTWGKRTTGTTRVPNEKMFKDVLGKRFKSTGEAERTLNAYMSIDQKDTNVMGFTGRTIDRNDNDGTQVSASADVYVSNSGKVNLFAHAYHDDESILILDNSKASVGIRRKLQVKDMAKTGDSSEKVILMEATLKVDSEKAQAQVADLKLA